MTTTHSELANVLKVDRTDRLIGVAALIVLAAALIAIARGHAEWRTLPWAVWTHLASALVALTLTPVMLWRRRGDANHRRLGYIWVGAMTITAGVSFAVRGINPGHFSLIHALSFWTLLILPFVVLFARRKNIVRHRSAMRSIVFGALIISGAFTFTFGRVLAHWLYGG